MINQPKKRYYVFFSLYFVRLCVGYYDFFLLSAIFCTFIFYGERARAFFSPPTRKMAYRGFVSFSSASIARMKFDMSNSVQRSMRSIHNIMLCYVLDAQILHMYLLLAVHVHINGE